MNRCYLSIDHLQTKNNPMFCSYLRVILSILPVLVAVTAFAAPSEICLFTDAKGTVQQVSSRSRIPEIYRSAARCISPTEAQRLSGGRLLAQPKDISLEGNVRSETITSPVGQINLRWPRKVEALFGRTPLRAAVEAARALNRSVSQASFPSAIQQMKLNWEIVFMDENLPETQIPKNLIDNCHPGWMTAPANIYIVSQRVVRGCGSERRVATSVADEELANVLIHEMGHALEYQLLGLKNLPDRLRAEGFATWFEGYAAQFTTVVDADKIINRQKALALASFRTSPVHFNFDGSAYSYARASMFFSAVENKQGISAINKIYSAMRGNRGLLFEAIKKATTWDEKRLHDEVRKFVGL